MDIESCFFCKSPLIFVKRPAVAVKELFTAKAWRFVKVVDEMHHPWLVIIYCEWEQIYKYDKY